MIEPEFKPANSSKSVTLSRTDYTEDQKMILDKALVWAKSSDMEYFTISGFAGTGKTTIARDIVRNLTGTIAVTAPTHKAARVASGAIGVEGNTIQKLLGLRPNTDLEHFDINNPQFDPLGTPYIKEYKYLLVDECSMVNKYLKKLIVDMALRYGTKVIFIGDSYQLPPVKEKYSLTFIGKNVYHLSTIVRQEEGNRLIELLTMARNDVKNKSNNLMRAFSKPNIVYNSDTDSGYIIAQPDDFAKILDDRFDSTDFENNIDYCRHSSFTNAAVLDINSYVRKKVIGDVNSILVEDDVLMSYSTIMDEFNAPIIVNSEDYIIDEILDYNNKFIIQGFLVTLRAVSNGKLTSKLFIVDHRNPEALSRYMAIFNGLLSKAKTSKNVITRREAWQQFYAFRNYNLLMTDLYSTGGTLIVSKDLDYAFGMTIHKTQGSTFDNIFINAKDVIYNKYGVPYSDMNLRNRLLYVALSRARNSAFILI